MKYLSLDGLTHYNSLLFDKIENKIDHLDVGGRNYFRSITINEGTAIVAFRTQSISVKDGLFTCVANGTDMFFGSAINAGSTYTKGSGYLIPVEPNSEYTLTLYDDNGLFTKNFITWIDSSYVSLGYISVNRTSNTVIVPSNARYAIIRIGYGNAVAGETYTFRAKFEKGNMSTDWTPALEDSLSTYSTINTDSGNSPLNITRFGLDSEQASIYFNDTGLVVDMANDEATNCIEINMSATDDANGGTNANTNQVRIASKADGSYIQADTFYGNLNGNANTATTSANSYNILAEDLQDRTISLNELTLSSGYPQAKYYYCRSDGGGVNITGRPDDNAKQAFNLKVELLRRTSETDFITKQTYTMGAEKETWIRYCNSGAWAAWKKILDTNNYVGYAAQTSHTHNYIPLTGSTGITGSLRTTGEYQTTSQNGLRIVGGNYGTILRNDGTNTYVLLTDAENQYGNWNSLRPLSISNTTGLVTCTNGIKGELTGNASTATKLKTARTIALTGSVNGSGTFDGNENLTIDTNTIITSSSGVSGTGGYIAMAQMVITGTYVNRPIEFKFISRGRSTACTVSVAFANSSGTDPELSSIKYWGTNYGVFIQKTSTSTWLLYVTKSEGYDNITLVGNDAAAQGVTITYPGTLITAKPTENVTDASLGGNFGNAASAEKLNTSAGSATQPIYFSGGKPVATTYALNKTVPSDAKFTDTTYSAGTGISLSGTTFSNSGVRSISTGSSNGTISVNTNGTSANVSVKGLGSAAYTATSAYLGSSGDQTLTNGALIIPDANTSNSFRVKRTVDNVVSQADLYISENGNPRFRFNSGGSTVNYLSLQSDSTVLGQPLALGSGGTGATTAKDARSNLGIGCTSLYSGTLKSGNCSFTYGSHKAYVIIGKPSSESYGTVTLFVPAAFITSKRTMQLADNLYYFLFDIIGSGTTGTITISTNNNNGYISNIYGVN